MLTVHAAVHLCLAVTQARASPEQQESSSPPKTPTISAWDSPILFSHLLPCTLCPGLRCSCRGVGSMGVHTLAWAGPGASSRVTTAAQPSSPWALQAHLGPYIQTSTGSLRGGPCCCSFTALVHAWDCNQLGCARPLCNDTCNFSLARAQTPEEGLQKSSLLL